MDNVKKHILEMAKIIAFGADDTQSYCEKYWESLPEWTKTRFIEVAELTFETLMKNIPQLDWKVDDPHNLGYPEIALMSGDLGYYTRWETMNDPEGCFQYHSHTLPLRGVNGTHGKAEDHLENMIRGVWNGY